MKNTSSLLFMLFCFLCPISSWSQIQFHEVIHKGSGCPEGSVSSIISPDGESLSFIFTNFRSEVPQSDGNNENDSLSQARLRRNSPSLNHKNCSLSFKTTIPEGFNLESLKVELMMRGGVILDAGVEGFFASILVGYTGLIESRGQPHVIVQKKWRSKNYPIDDDFLFNPVKNITLNSKCATRSSQTVKFDLKNHIRAEIPNQDLTKNGHISLDSIDSMGMLKIKIVKRKCPR